MYLLGYDIGSSSVKASLVEIETGICRASAFSPKKEMTIRAEQPGWAEQDPDQWWQNLKLATQEVLEKSGIPNTDIKAIGISYQMHGLVCIDKDFRVLRPSIIWCDSRAVGIGDKAFAAIGKEKCLSRLLNSPGNFTASKLRWVFENEPALYEKIYKIMLPGDFIAMKLSGDVSTTVSGLSEGILWDFINNQPSDDLMKYYGIRKDLLPEILPTFSVQGKVSSSCAKETGLPAGVPIAYRAGDQPNNAFSLKVLQPGEIAATAGTSGVVYGVSGSVQYDPQSRVNTFAHVTHEKESTRLGVLLCINGTGILNSWLKYNMGYEQGGYEAMNQDAAGVPVGSAGLAILPFGNGAERMLGNKNPGSLFSNLDFNRHTRAHVARAAQEGIVFSFKYGMDIMEQIGIHPGMIRAGHANMFLSPLFREALACITGAQIELYNTDGSQGAAIGAGVGAGYFKSFQDAFSGLKKILTVEPDHTKVSAYQEAYGNWMNLLKRSI